MKLFYNLFKSPRLVSELKQRVAELEKENRVLQDENQSLWDMLDEIKKSEQEAFIYYNSLNTESVGEA
jgi:regulator of replication initiation timing|tara:strand:+ start:299 stop:502 length:204 start_codon:yes stop_codon:yes gene_type:complete